MHQKFKNWCRLCAKHRDATIDVLESPKLRTAIEKHFYVKFVSDQAPTTICGECYECLLKLIEFEDMVFRAQSVFQCASDSEPNDDYSVNIEVSSFFEELVNDIEEENSVYQCTHCEMVFESETDLHRHMSSHPSVKYTCEICGTEFGKSFTLRNHRKLVHSNDRPFICDECGKGFKRSGDLNRHKEFHRDDTPFACSVCDKKFKSKLVRKMHEKNHTEAKFTCTVCGQELKTKHTLRGHMQIHSDDLKYDCKYCGKKFRYKKNLSCHLLTHTGLQPFNCAFCNQAFSLRWNCRTHQKKIHPNELAEYEKEGKSTIITSLTKQKFSCGQRRGLTVPSLDGDSPG